ncbi:hypothetical protein ACHWQZ_G007224 [Mnemiopsis leidyi]
MSSGKVMGFGQSTSVTSFNCSMKSLLGSIPRDIIISCRFLFINDKVLGSTGAAISSDTVSTGVKVFLGHLEILKREYPGITSRKLSYMLVVRWCLIYLYGTGMSAGSLAIKSKASNNFGFSRAIKEQYSLITSSDGFVE